MLLLCRAAPPTKRGERQEHTPGVVGQLLRMGLVARQHAARTFCTSKYVGPPAKHCCRSEDEHRLTTGGGSGAVAASSCPPQMSEHAQLWTVNTVASCGGGTAADTATGAGNGCASARDPCLAPGGGKTKTQAVQPAEFTGTHSSLRKCFPSTAGVCLPAKGPRGSLSR